MRKKFKVGDKVRCVYNDNGTQEYVGMEGKITRIDRKNERGYGIYVSFAPSGTSFADKELVKIAKLSSDNPQYLLQYELASDPLELFGSLETLKARIRHLVEHERNLKRDKIFVYELGDRRKIDVEVLIKGI